MVASLDYCGACVVSAHAIGVGNRASTELGAPSFGDGSSDCLGKGTAR